ncbi:unnamed protein product [Dicrocoelium dendriticum]|nr:unnamed protein product [Dicrocoelium dendriticum]
MNPEVVKNQQQTADSEWDVRNPFRKFSFTSYLREEVVQSVRKRQEHSGTEDRGPFTNRVYTFITVPQYFESFMNYGLLQCLDHLLVIYTFLPLRCILVAARLLFHLLTEVPQSFWKTSLKTSCRIPLLFSHEVRDLIRFSLLLICTFLLVKVDTSVAYHEIRTQSVIKIYIFFNLLEVADRLLSAVCQDALDDLLHTASKLCRRCCWHQTNEASGDSVEDLLALARDLLLQYSFALICLFAHCFLLLCQVTTINVAFNSQNKSLVTVFISNNFVELKGNVFRKMGKTNLFQIACADVRERFHYAIWLFIVVCRNMTDTGWNTDDLWSMMFDVSCIFLAEVAVDWVKHSFITKFNVIPSDVYKEYTVSIAYDLLLCRQGKNTADYFDLLSRRMGLTPIPLSCLINVMLLQTVRNPSFLWLCLPTTIILLFGIKIIANMTLLSFAYAHVKAYIREASAAYSQTHEVSPATTVDPKLTNPESPSIVKRTASEPHTEHLYAETHPHRPPIPVRYTGYDQSTREEDPFLPMVLRQRRFRSESGCCSDLSAFTSTELGATVDDFRPVIESIESAALETNGVGASLKSDLWIHHYVDPDLPKEASIVSSDQCRDQYQAPTDSLAHLRTRDESQSSRSGQQVTYTNKMVFADDALTKEQLVISQPVLTSSFLTQDDRSRTSMVSDLTIEADKRKPCETATPLSNEVGTMRRSRRYSIDLGALNAFRRLRLSESNQDAFSGALNVVEANPSSSTLLRTEPIHRRRKRTRTEGSDNCDIYRRAREIDLPAMWEPSGRTSIIEPFDTARLFIKQPLSDIDRYSMIEGQIS